MKNLRYAPIATILLSFASIAPVVQAEEARFPYCERGDSDSDGDGYGWENEQTCLVQSQGTSASYTVQVRNLTYQQVLSPILAVTHSDDISLYAPGEPASDGVAAIAEGGDISVLDSALQGAAMVSATANSGGPVMPAHSTTFTVDAGPGDVISVLTMLVNTNDAFAALGNAKLPTKSGDYYVYRPATYDAGSETNDESCASIPGPACGGSGPSPSDDGEGFIHIHRGLYGGADLSLFDYAWRDPAVEIIITRN